MKEIKILANHIEEELGDAYTYIKLAHEYKESNPEMANIFYRLSNDEMTHQDMLHKQVKEIIMDYKRQHGEPPVAMEAVYNHLHERFLEKAAKVVNMQNLYKR